MAVKSGPTRNRFFTTNIDRQASRCQNAPRAIKDRRPRPRNRPIGPLIKRQREKIRNVVCSTRVLLMSSTRRPLAA